MERGAQPGNRNAAGSGEWRQAIRRALAHKHGSYDKGLQALAAKLIDKAEEGDIGALKEVGDREDGRPAQQVHVSGDSENPLQLIQRTIVDGKK